jgi:hypothetical protein
MHVAGGADEFLRDHAVIVMSDHAQVAVSGSLNLVDALPSWKVLGPLDDDPSIADIAVCPSQRSAQIYALDRDKRSGDMQRLVRDLRSVDGLDVVAWRDGSEAVVWTPRGELRIAPGGELVDPRGGEWSVEGELDALGLSVADGRIDSELYPLAPARLWSALDCPHAGDILISAATGIEFVDWGGVAHIGGGSHGSLHRGDSLGVLLTCGVEPPAGGVPEQWTIADVTPMALHHFSLPS